MSADFGEQLTFSGLETKPKKRSSRNSTAGAPKIAETLPIASVIVEKLPIHLDQQFDYVVPEKFDDIAVPGALVKVPFGNQQLDGYIVARKQTSQHDGRLSPLKSVVSKLSLINDDALSLYRAVAQYYGGSVSDVLRLAVPPRHAAAEKVFLEQFATQSKQSGPTSIAPSLSAKLPDGAAASAEAAVLEAWQSYQAGPAYLERLSYAATTVDGVWPRAVWSALPGYGFEGRANEALSALPHWALMISTLARHMQRLGKRTLIVVPDAKDVRRVTEALDNLGFVLFGSSVTKAETSSGAEKGASDSSDGSEPHAAIDTDTARTGHRASYVMLTHELSPAARYTSYLAASHGLTDVVVGTRAAALTPIPDLGLAVCWDDGDSSHQDLHAPYPHTREVLSLRSEVDNVALLIGSFGRTLHAQSLLASGWAGEIVSSRDVVRVRAPHVIEFGEFEIAADSGGRHGRLPERVWREIRKALARGPVLIQVPRGGYLPTVACARCREAARCMQCHGPLGLDGARSAPQCRWCGALNGAWACDSCGCAKLRAMRIGSERTAEELGRAFPGVPIISSAARARDGVQEEVLPRPSLVISTPGAEPHVPGGYALAALLDAHVGSGSSGLYAHQECLARWQNAASLVQSRARGGQVFLVGKGASLPTSALVRWHAGYMAERELGERSELHLPPAWRTATVSGDRISVSHFLGMLDLPEQAETLGPVVVDSPNNQTLDGIPYVRAIVRVPLKYGRELAKSLYAMARIASAKRQTQRVDVVLDPKELL